MKQKRTVIDRNDDFDGTPDAETVPFAFEGVSYEIELSGKNLKEMRSMMEAYVNAGRRVGGRKATKGASRKASSVDSAAVRTWAQENGVEVGSTGKIGQAVIDQYLAST